MQKCGEPGCSNNVFGGGYCKYHQFRRKMSGGDQHTRKKPPNKASNSGSEALSHKGGYKIPPESKTRQKERIYYKTAKDEIRAEMIANKCYNCFFCGLGMNGEMGFHHLKGRDGDFYFDKKYLVPAHNECHVEKYHRLSIEFLIREPWYPAFMKRLEAIDPQLLNKEYKKQERGLLFDYEG